MRILAKLHDPEESIAISAELRVDHSINGKCERATFLSEFAVLRVERLLARVERVRLVDAHVQHVPFESVGAALELPVA